jgi:hypothetical protein
VDVNPAAAVGVLVAETVGRASFDRLSAVLMNHPWPVRKPVTYRFNWIATLLRELLYPHPKLPTGTG